MREELEAEKFTNVVSWTRGVDIEQFHPDKRTTMPDPFEGLPRPIFLNVGRVAVEKNIETFLKLDLPGSKVVVGDGPQLEELKKAYPETTFLGSKFGDELAACFAHSDVFLFPSLTDTFGLVIIEAMATGTPVAGFNAPGPKDIIPGSNAGYVGDDLKQAALDCLDLDRKTVRKYAEGYSWRACADAFLLNLEPLPVPERKRFWKRLRRIRRREERDQTSVL